MRLALTCAALVLASPALATEVVLQNDAFSGMSQLYIEGNFAAKEGVGESFSPPAAYYPFRIVGVQFMVVGENGAEGGTDRPTIVAYRDEGRPAPGAELVRTTLGTADMPIEGTTRFIQTAEFSDQPTVTAGPVRVALFFNKATRAGGLTMLSDRSVSPARHSTLCHEPAPGAPCVWDYSATLGVKGTWLLRLVIDTMGNVPGPDMGGGTRRDMVLVPPGGAPYVESIIPSMLPEGMGGPAIIRGGGFVTMAPRSTVLLDSAERGPVSLGGVLVEDERTIKIQIPEGLQAGFYDVVVQNPDGQSGRLSRGLTITPAATKAGCSCEVAGGSRPPVGGWLLALSLLALLLWLVRRRVASA
ncbi:MAG: MYXO-CTERM sorting domain-containing protein [Myxococcales bacterium]|nr:MYXO-CTERM sorting domain-containing protein [Myxococcota bacterium]MDW8280177.1 MYXO-CTERM sorting domain-containing protein [Myxococcales bacterium]